jgi:hypothetical protein
MMLTANKGGVRTRYFRGLFIRREGMRSTVMAGNEGAWSKVVTLCALVW